MRKQWLLKALALLAIVSILSGCGGAATPTAAPEVDAQATFSVVQTSAVETVIANLTQNAPTAVPATATALPTDTSEPTSTPEQPTATQPPTSTPVTPTATFVPWTATPSRTPVTYACTLTEAAPASGSKFKPGDPFDGRWVIKNTSKNTWFASQTDILYVSGTKFQENVDTLDAAKDVKENETMTIIVDMLAPNDPGSYSSVWAVRSAGQTVCMMYINISVQR